MTATKTAVALSGGGHRATLWGLGVLLYLAAAKRNHQVTSISSVSGGSLANAAVGQRLDYTSASADDVEEVVRDVSRVIARRGTVFGWWGAWLYVSLVVLGGLGLGLGLVEAITDRPWAVDAPIARQVSRISDAAWTTGVTPWLKWLILVVAVLAWLKLIAARGSVTARAFEHTLLSPPGRSKKLDGLHDGLDHVICATDLHAGEHVYFSSIHVCAYRFGYGGNGELPLRRAVQASAAFPPVFPVAWVKTKLFGFQAAGETVAASTKHLALTDGGVYDNMADQWAYGLDERNKRWGLDFRPATELIVANSSAGVAWKTLRSLRLPVWGAVAALLRDKSVLYDNGTSVRRRELVSSFDLAAATGVGMVGALVHIPQSPFTIPSAFAGDPEPWPDRAERAQAALTLLSVGDADAERRGWKQVAEANAAVKTTLVSFSPEVCARLLQHAYVLAMINLHVILDYPLLELPTRQSFLALIGDVD